MPIRQPARVYRLGRCLPPAAGGCWRCQGRRHALMSTTYTQGRIQPVRLLEATFHRFPRKLLGIIPLCFEIWQKKNNNDKSRVLRSDAYLQGRIQSVGLWRGFALSALGTKFRGAGSQRAWLQFQKGKKSPFCGEYSNNDRHAAKPCDFLLNYLQDCGTGGVSCDSDPDSDPPSRFRLQLRPSEMDSDTNSDSGIDSGLMGLS